MVQLQVPLPIGLYEGDLGMRLAAVAGDRLVDMPDEPVRNPASMRRSRSADGFSSRKYSDPAAPLFHSRMTDGDVLTSWTLTAALEAITLTFADPWFALHQADGRAGVLPPPPQLPPAIRHESPMPAEE